MKRKTNVTIALKLLRRLGAPAKPTQAALAKLCSKAWHLAPANRRPDICGQMRAVLDVLMVDDTEIAALNVSHLKKRGPTDVLAFPMGETDPERKAYHLGEVVVSFTTALREARARRITEEEELSRYCVHGFLHLLGYEDTTAKQRETLFALQEKSLEECGTKSTE